MTLTSYSSINHFLRRHGFQQEGRDSLEDERPPAEVCPHPQLRAALMANPSMAAILGVAPVVFALRHDCSAPFYIDKKQVVGLPTELLDDSAALAVCARWAVELCRSDRCVKYSKLWAGRSLAFVRALLSLCPPQSRARVLALVPDSLARSFLELTYDQPLSEDAIAWVESLMSPAECAEGCRHAETSVSGFDSPIEAMLVSGGDSRLNIDAETHLNKYGVPPFPRPEAIHFSSSTASAVSDQGFRLLEYIRQFMNRRVGSGAPAEGCEAALIDVIEVDLLDYIGVSPKDNDIVVVPSGTDAELVSVLLSVAYRPSTPLVSVVVSPDESGRGVVLAASGRYFDHQSPSGMVVERGEAALRNAAVKVIEIGTRDSNNSLLPAEQIDKTVETAVRDAVSGGSRVLLHVLHASKLGHRAPSDEVIERLLAIPGKCVDVVIDACQFRSEPAELRQYLRNGCLVQVSGSKFLTGPPLSAAVLIPAEYRGRLGGVNAVVPEQFPICAAEDWSGWWKGKLAWRGRGGNVGASMRWLPALLELQQYRKLDDKVVHDSVERFQAAVLERIANEPTLHALDCDPGASCDGAALRWSIVAFEIHVREANGVLRPLEEDGYRDFFELLNADVALKCLSATESERRVLRVPCHIGQPVTLRSAVQNRTVLRIVLGVRFFNQNTFACELTREAAIQSEIADASRVVAKCALMAEKWSEIRSEQAPTTRSECPR